MTSQQPGSRRRPLAVAGSLALAAPLLACAAPATAQPPAARAMTQPSTTLAPPASPAPTVTPTAGGSPVVTKRLDPAAVPSTGGVRLSPTAQGPLSSRTIVVDPGHNGRYVAAVNTRPVPDGNGGRKACNSSGTSTSSGYSEHAHNWAVAGRLATMLRAQGATVVLTRPTDRGVGPCVDERAAIGNRADADLVLSIHADGAATSGRGFHIIRSAAMAGGKSVTARSARLATIARDSYARVTGMPRSTYLGKGTAITPRRDIAGVNLAKVPAVMLEAGNMRNAKDARLLTSPAFQAKEAAALADAARRFLR